MNSYLEVIFGNEEKLNIFYNLTEKIFFYKVLKMFVNVAQELTYRKYNKFKIKQDKLYKLDYCLEIDE